MNKKLLFQYISMTIFIILFISILTFVNQYLFSNDKVLATIIGLFYMSVISLAIIYVVIRVIGVVGISPNIIFILFTSFYIIAGIIPMSSYRDNINLEFWILMLVISIIFLIIGQLLGRLTVLKLNMSKNNISENKINTKMSFVLYTISVISTLIILFRFGLVFLEPTKRFLVPSELQYLVELSVPITVCIFSYYYNSQNKNYKLFLIPLMSLIILLSLGYRNQPMLLIMGIILIIVFKNLRAHHYKYGLKPSIFISSGLTFLLFVFSFLFIIRQENSVELLDWASFINFYQVKNHQFSFPLFPIHLSSREAMGVTTVAIERFNEIKNYLGNGTLFFQDLFTLLPGNQTTAGNILGMVVNRRETVSLTPGLIGGLYLSSGLIGVIIGFMLIGFILSYNWYSYRIYGSLTNFSIMIITLIYSIELINRGVFKPMYLLVLIIPLILFSRIHKKEEEIEKNNIN
ncbi:hypothetical protein LIT32_23650 [Bacillus sp. CMF21]|nr:hypothetical protein LIT32_23650 [Bacillus sp. CMF21]